MKKESVVVLLLVAIFISSVAWGGYSIIRGKSAVFVPQPLGVNATDNDGSIQINTGYQSFAPTLRFKCGGVWYAVSSTSEGS